MPPRRRGRPLRDRITQQARDEAQLRFGPQRRQLNAQQQSIADQFAQGARIEQASARGIAESIDQVKPKVAGYAGNAQSLVDQGSRDLSQYLSGSVLQGAAARDSVGTRSRLAEMLANANTELDTRKVDAQAGAKYTIGALRSNAAKALEDVGGRMSDLANDEGVYVSSRSGELREDAQRRALTRRGQNITRRGQDLSHQDRVASRRAADRRAEQRESERARSESRLPGGSQRAPAAAQRSAVNKFEQALGDVQRLLANPDLRKRYPALGGPKSKAQRALVARSLVGLDDYKTSQPLLSAALDMHYDGHLSRATQKRLHRLGIEVNRLGEVVTAGEFRKRRPSVSYGALGNFPRITPLRAGR